MTYIYHMTASIYNKITLWWPNNGFLGILIKHRDTVRFIDTPPPKKNKTTHKMDLQLENWYKTHVTQRIFKAWNRKHATR